MVHVSCLCAGHAIAHRTKYTAHGSVTGDRHHHLYKVQILKKKVCTKYKQHDPTHFLETVPIGHNKVGQHLSVTFMGLNCNEASVPET